MISRKGRTRLFVIFAAFGLAAALVLVFYLRRGAVEITPVAPGSGLVDGKLLISVQTKAKWANPGMNEPAIAVNGVYRPSESGSERTLESSNLFYEARISPDGKTMAMVAESGTLVLWDLASGAFDSIDGISGIPVWNPSSDFVLISRQRPGEMLKPAFRISRGAKKVEPYEFNASYLIEDWHPKSELIVVTIFERSANTSTNRLALVTPTGTLKERLDVATFALRPRVSPDGSKIAFVASNPPGASLMIYDLRSKATSTALGDVDANSRVSWSPDGKGLAICDSRAVRLLDLGAGKLVPFLSQEDAAGGRRPLSFLGPRPHFIGAVEWYR